MRLRPLSRAAALEGVEEKQEEKREKAPGWKYRGLEGLLGREAR